MRLNTLPSSLLSVGGLARRILRQRVSQSSFTSAITIAATRQTIRIVIEIFQLAGTLSP